jgi:poly [ADP-ribose] polymerase
MDEHQGLYLIKVEPTANNNKYYRMIPHGDTFEVQYGRVGYENYQSDTYSICNWDKKLKEKLRKGYVDNTSLVAEIVGKKKDSQYAEISDKSVAKIVERLQSMARQAIRDNYTITSNKVTQKMIDEAQLLIDQLGRASSVEQFNGNLVELFKTIPRKMTKVADHLATQQDDFSVILQREQDLLDVMAGQVVVQQSVAREEIGSVESSETILDALGLGFCGVSGNEILEIKKHLGNISDKFSDAWAVVNNKSQSAFDKFIKDNNIASKKLLWHGSRNENWWSIVNSGLVLRPNAVITGKMFGNGIYFAPSAGKSFGYTSYSGSYWAGGKSNVAFMSLFDVAYGKPYDVHSFEGRLGSFDYEKLQSASKGANCLHAHAGQMLRNDEIIVYKEEQITIKYLVELK